MKATERISSEVGSGRLSEGRERHLMEEVVNGSERAFRELVTGLRPLIVSVIHRTIGAGSDVDDISQTVLISVWNGAARWNPAKGRVSTWVAV